MPSSARAPTASLVKFEPPFHRRLELPAQVLTATTNHRYWGMAAGMLGKGADERRRLVTRYEKQKNEVLVMSSEVLFNATSVFEPLVVLLRFPLLPLSTPA